MLKIVLMLIAAYCALNYAGIMCACLQNSQVVEIVDIVLLLLGEKLISWNHHYTEFRLSGVLSAVKAGSTFCSGKN